VKKYYVCYTNSRSGISRYSEDFYRLILEPLLYEHIQPSVINQIFLEKLSKDTCFHLELGAGQFAERDVLMKLIKCGFVNINVTVHDPPFITFPFYRFKSPILNRLSRGFDWYLNAFGGTKRALAKCNTIFVLSQKGKHIVESRYGLTNIQYIPHIVDPGKVARDPLDGSTSDVLFFGFIGPKKGLDYALRLHAEIQKDLPGIRLHVIGEAIGSKATKYFEFLKNKYDSNVIYHGFVNESDLDGIFNQVAHVFLPFQEYGYICPVSGSVLYALRRGRVVWTNSVNAIGELVISEQNGMFFSSNLEVDSKKFLSISSSVANLQTLSEAALASAQSFGPKNLAFLTVA
jgi:glycosyltransferase involved in cell wall biosynthesis